MKERIIVTVAVGVILNLFMLSMVVFGASKQPVRDIILPTVAKFTMGSPNLREAHEIELHEDQKAEYTEENFIKSARCVACHGDMIKSGDLADPEGPDPKFHKKHLKRDIATLVCVDCHNGKISLGIHRLQKGTVQVHREVCVKCHGPFPGDSPASLMKPEFKGLNCLKCHGGVISAGQPPQLMHDKPYLKPIMDKSKCLTCHGEFQLPTVSGHDKDDWIGQHATNSPNIDDCKACHTKSLPELDFCAQCHDPDWEETLTGSAPQTIDAVLAAQGKEQAQKACTACHGFENLTNASYEADQWGDVVGRMKGKGCSMTDEEEKAILEYLRTGDVNGKTPAGGAAAGGGADPAAIAKGKEQAQKTCTACHGFENLENASYEPGQWGDVMGRMKGKGCNMTDEEEAAIMAFLDSGQANGKEPAGGGAETTPTAAGGGGIDAKAAASKACTACHDAERIKSASHEGDAWKEVVGRMKGKGCNMTGEEEAAIIEFLAGGGNKEL